MRKETIAAIATAMSDLAIGIIRISGPEAFLIADRVFKRKKQKPLSEEKANTVHYGFICDGEERLDEVLVIIMKAPHSYTAEDTVEIDCHGGVLMMKKILEVVIKNGARAAEPGEFTKRAFLNGKMDLSQAEAVKDVIQAKNEYALKSSVSQLRGSISKKMKELRAEILYEMAYIESALDDPEHISLDGYGERLSVLTENWIERVNHLLSTADKGKVMKEGIRTVILGKPNAGKSSLMNVLVGEERAIVTEIAGTTRDTLEEHIYLNGISLNVVDTAGIRETEDVVEQIGVSRARDAAKDADLIIYVVDGSRPLDENDSEIMDFIRDKKAVVLLNKSDLSMVVSAEELRARSGHKVIPISAKEELGIELLEDEIKNMFYQGEKFPSMIEDSLTNVRHKEALEQARESLKMVRESIENGMPEDFYSIDLMDACRLNLGVIIGEEVGEEIW